MCMRQGQWQGQGKLSKSQLSNSYKHASIYKQEGKQKKAWDVAWSRSELHVGFIKLMLGKCCVAFMFDTHSLPRVVVRTEAFQLPSPASLQILEATAFPDKFMTRLMVHRNWLLMQRSRICFMRLFIIIAYESARGHITRHKLHKYLGVHPF